jgi:ribosomal protein S18 acetylase RimI-like enzyme
MRGYIAMLDVDEKTRRKKIGSNLVTLAIKRMIQNNADEVYMIF